MAWAFLKEYAVAAGDCMLSKNNSYYNTVGGLDKKSSVPSGGLLFREAELGITYSALQILVFKAVRTSVIGTATRTFAPPGVPELRMEKGPAQWDDKWWFDQLLSVNGFSVGVIVTGSNGGNSNVLDAMMESDKNIPVSMLEMVIRKRKTPFANGAMRLASFARTQNSTSRYVVKEFKDDGNDQQTRRRTLAHLAEDMRAQALCKAFALEYNWLVRDISFKFVVYFLVTRCFKCKNNGEYKDKCMSIEPYLPGNFVKYNGNAGYTNQDPELADNPSNLSAQAFSHFTYERSRGRFLVCDLQGVGKMMTDPAVHTRDSSRFGQSATNLGVEGFKFFFAYHKCNHLCRQLGLKSNGQSLVDDGIDAMQFRHNWPPMAEPVCCSNKLCRQIVFRVTTEAADSRRESQSRHPSYPGYHWCDKCLPQLSDEQFKMKKTSYPNDGSWHTFEISGFFYESQGRRMPRQCPEHE